MQNKTFMDKLKLSTRKLVISIKRNYYIIPLLIILAGCVQFLCGLYILSNNMDRVSQHHGNYNCMFVFIIALLAILSTVAYLNYALVKYGQKRPTHMLILYLVMVIINVVLLIIVLKANAASLLDEKASLAGFIAKGDITGQATANEQIANCLASKKVLINQLIFIGVAVVVVLTAPIVQSSLNKLKFKRVEQNGN